jgi:hypothetical protein
LFTACPGTRPARDTAPAKIWSAAPFNDTSYNVTASFDLSEGSAAIFAGSLALLMEANRRLTLADHLFITAMTATKVHNESVLWALNAFGLWFNRRVGFGRLNLGKAITLAKNWESVGDIFEKTVAKTKLDLVLISSNKRISHWIFQIRRRRLLFRCW